MQIVYIILLMSCRADPGKSVALTKYQRNQEEPDPHCNNLFLISSWPLDDPYSSLTSVTVLSTFHGNKISWSKTQRHANQWCTWTSAFTGQDKKKKGREIIHGSGCGYTTQRFTQWLQVQTCYQRILRVIRAAPGRRHWHISKVHLLAIWLL